MSKGVTDRMAACRRCSRPPWQAGSGGYRLTFDVGDYFRDRGVESFYSEVAIDFVVRDAAAHYHVPLLLSPYGYSTYRGSLTANSER